MNQASGTATPFRQASGNRTTDIMTITDGIRAVLAGFPVTVVTTRPAAGPYVMVVFGGSAGAVGSNFSLAVNELDCDDSENSDVLWISDASGVPLQRLINVAVGGIGFGLGLTATADPNDCMCGWTKRIARDPHRHRRSELPPARRRVSRRRPHPCASALSLHGVASPGREHALGRPHVTVHDPLDIRGNRI